ncbi:gluconate:H+ symporter GntP family transporter [Rhodovulum sulfidophilum]|uniref:Gluconate:H+ symporter GntP family transporter n=1 Tax=Rhodovulum sulfidophilum TaxID=35806 RepID=A0A0D6B1S2_RHOSU|nr:gluconate:H+ symporter GntP family transporter [Rhodovulum sulfidophilum]
MAGHTLDRGGTVAAALGEAVVTRDRMIARAGKDGAPPHPGPPDHMVAQIALPGGMTGRRSNIAVLHSMAEGIDGERPIACRPRGLRPVKGRDLFGSSPASEGRPAAGRLSFCNGMNGLKLWSNLGPCSLTRMDPSF